MSYTKFAFAAIGLSLLATTALATGLKNGTPTPGIDAKLASVGASGEIPLGLLIKTPETPHGASFSRQVASATMSVLT